MREYRPTYVEIDQGAIAENVHALRGLLPGGVHLMAAVKADAYGHGLVETSRTVLHAGGRALAVALVEEGVQLREAGIRAPILVLGPVTAEGAEAAVAYDLTQTVPDMEVLYNLDMAAKKLGNIAHAHVKMDTGMGRIGFRNVKEVELLIQSMSRRTHVVLDGAFTHFSCADMPGDYTRMQIEKFRELCAPLDERRLAPLRHAANSAGILDYPEAYFDMVRAGIALYGYYPSETTTRPIPLKPALSFHSEISFVKAVEAGSSISYGATFTADRGMRIATLPVGYGDGYHRRISNRGCVLIRGKRCRILGNICMDQMMVDITNLPFVKPGEPVVLLGQQGDEKIDADEIAGWADTISYEVLLAITARVPRIMKYPNP
ncbi:MAG: alanine racemase [Clostridia bacterium]|nr:alanine racemase [Clostridia bacterium]